MIRTSHGVGLRDMAARIGISASHLSRLENGERQATADLMNRICHALGHLPLDEVAS
jgi:transcriptional regulator with XRE-family HTH domain